MNFLENITLRRTRSKAQPKHDSDVTASTALNDTVDSVPEMSDDESEEVKALRDQILNITLELQTAQSRIEILTQENIQLKQLNETLTKQNNSGNNSSSNSGSTPKTKSATDKKTAKNKKKKIDSNAHSETNKGMETQVTQREYDYQVRAPKMCILSTDNKNKLLDIADNTLKWSKRCHYITPHGTTQQLLRDIKEKLSDFTQEDYCIIILIGEEDFRVTKVYVDIVTYIREILQEIKHTNVIICTPTFKCGNLQ
uniref:Uncharacterized protein n=1 Tax=Heliothis virescens TaxID=7102 RepID=A0A2A4ISN9_HELVI